MDVANKANLQISETVKHCISSIPQEMSEWLGCSSSSKSSVLNLFLSKPMLPPPWRLRLSSDNFSLWWKSKGVYTIFFNGASKGNRRIAGAGGLIFSLDNEKIYSFCWGLVICSNNQAESYNLLMSCQIAKNIGLKEIQIFGDSEVLIKLLNSDS